MSWDLALFGRATLLILIHLAQYRTHPYLLDTHRAGASSSSGGIWQADPSDDGGMGLKRGFSVHTFPVITTSAADRMRLPPAAAAWLMAGQVEATPIQSVPAQFFRESVLE